MHLILFAFVVFAACQPAAAVQRADGGGPHMLISSSDSLGVRIEDRPALIIDTDKVVVPSLYVYGTSDIRLNFEGEAHDVRAIYEVPNLGVCMLVFGPPIPAETVPKFDTAINLADIGAWLHQEDEASEPLGDGRVRVLRFQRNPASVALVVTPAPSVELGTVFYYSNGRAAGMLAEPVSLQPGHPNAMSLCPTLNFEEYAARAEEHQRDSARTIGSWAETSSAVVDELVRLLLAEDLDAESLQRFGTQWNEREPGWSKRIPHELFFTLATITTKYRLGQLQRQLLQSPPEMPQSEVDRLRLAKAVHLVQTGPVTAGMAGLWELIDEGGSVMPVACMVVADILSRQNSDESQTTAIRLLRQTVEEYETDPRPYEIGARVYASYRATALYVDMARLWQTLDYAVSASLGPSVQLLEWDLPEEAVEFARTGVERWPDDLACREVLIRALVKFGDVDAAREHLSDLGRSDANRASALLDSLPELNDP